MSIASFEQHVPVWIWSSVKGKVKLTKEKTETHFGKQIVLQNTSTSSSSTSSDIKEDSKLSIVIEAKGSLQYDDGQGWKWHKSWILPDIQVTMNIKSSSGQTCLPPPQTFIEIYQVKKNDFEEWESVGMRGISKIQAESGQVEFGKGLKLSQTSYGHQGSRFYLVIAGYIQEANTTKTIFSYASPSIFVDSRKSDREFKLQRELNFIDLFSPDILQKPLYKQLLQQDQIEIINSPEGFYNFITASNLRNKIKHPIYLAIKFSSVFQLMCKSEVQSDRQLLVLLERLQTNLVYKQYQCQNTEDALLLKVQSFKSFKRNRKLNESLKHLSTLLTVFRDDKCNSSNIENYHTITPDQLTRVYSSNQIQLQTTLRTAKSHVYKLGQKKEIESDPIQLASLQEIELKKIKVESTETNKSTGVQGIKPNNQPPVPSNLQYQFSYLAYYLQQLSQQQLYIQPPQINNHYLLSVQEQIKVNQINQMKPLQNLTKYQD